MYFSQLSQYFEKIEQTPSRLTMTSLLADLFKELGKDEIDKVLYLLQGRVTPLFVRGDFKMAERMLIRSLMIAFNATSSEIKKNIAQTGDIGLTAEHLKTIKPALHQKNIEVTEVYKRLRSIVDMEGEGSQDTKISAFADLFSDLDPLSCRYIARIPINTLRLGFSDMTVLDAFSWMIVGDKSLKKQIEKAYQVRPDIGYIGLKLKTYGIEGLKNVRPVLFTPILMMKAERLSDPFEIIKKAGEDSYVEPKYDGFRLQIHYKKKTKEVRLFSRNLDDVTYMYPDIAEAVIDQLGADEIIFEGEAVGFDPKTGGYLPFQQTVQRKRKYNIKEKAKEIPLKLFAFDILYLNSKNLLNTFFELRRSKLLDIVKVKNTKKDVIVCTDSNVAKSATEVEKQFDSAVKKGLEGIVVKKREGFYQPGARDWSWIKYKRSYASKISDTIDCVVIGYDRGKGKRSDFGIGAFLVAVFDSKKKEYVTVAKIGTGLTDLQWRQLKKKCDQYLKDKKPALYSVDKQMEPDIWIAPEIVVEIRSDEITKSPVHTAGRVLRHTKTGKAWEVDVPGFALRFPRLERFRKDKGPSDITTVAEVEKLYKSQKK